MVTMKTAITVLQEMMVKLGETPEYECISQSGPMHLATFEYRCVALGEVVTASAHSKKEAKQNAANLMLQKLSLKGHQVSPPFGLRPNFSTQNQEAWGTKVSGDPTSESTSVRSYYALLKELCEEFSMPAVNYDLVGDTGPPHLRHFTVRVFVGSYERLATSTTKKSARRIAAEQLYTYLRENLSRVTAEFSEKDALVRVHEKARDRYLETKEEGPRKTDLSQKISDYHLGLFLHVEEEKRTATERALGDNLSPESAESVLQAVAGLLDLTVQWTELECYDDDGGSGGGGGLCALELSGTSPVLTFVGAERAAASLDALRYIRTALRFRPARV